MATARDDFEAYIKYIKEGTVLSADNEEERTADVMKLQDLIDGNVLIRFGRAVIGRDVVVNLPEEQIGAALIVCKSIVDAKSAIADGCLIDDSSVSDSQVDVSAVQKSAVYNTKVTNTIVVSCNARNSILDACDLRYIANIDQGVLKGVEANFRTLPRELSRISGRVSYVSMASVGNTVVTQALS